MINIILNIQNPPENRLPQQVEKEYSDLKSLVLNEWFNGKVQTYQYTPNNESLRDMLYPKLIHVANKHTSYKISVDVKATFQSPKYDKASFYIQSKRYTRYETNKQESLLQDLQNGIDVKDTEGSGWKVHSIDLC